MALACSVLGTPEPDAHARGHCCSGLSRVDKNAEVDGARKIFGNGFSQAHPASFRWPEPGVSGLKQNCSFTEESIELAGGINWKFFEFIRHRSGPCFELASEAPLAPRECWQKAAKTDANVRYSAQMAPK